MFFRADFFAISCFLHRNRKLRLPQKLLGVAKKLKAYKMNHIDTASGIYIEWKENMMALPLPPPPSRFGKKAILAIVVSVIFIVAIISSVVLLGGLKLSSNPNPSATPNPADISGVGIVNGYGTARMVVDSAPSQAPYKFKVWITVEIKNPTAHDVTLRLHGSVDVTLSGDMTGRQTLDGTQDIFVPKYSQAQYEIPIFITTKTYTDSNAVIGTVNDHTITELWRGTGAPPT
jgi:hypothetical protein